MKATRAGRGFGLIDALIALAVLSFGLLALTRFQTRLVAQTTEAQERLTAVQLGDELLSTVLVDRANAACYTLPQAGACGSAVATARADAWLTAVGNSLNSGAATATLAGDRLTLAITWTGKDSQDTRTHQAVTDVR